ncbi:MAG: Rieske 2Fe-2S domain-containing protein [Ktedonobacterales bacterium]
MREVSHEGADDTATNVNPQPTEPTPSLTDRISDSLQNVIKAVIGSNRQPPRRLKSLLNGTWLGHPLHPALTDVPIGAWLLAVILDIIWLVAPAAQSWAGRGAEVAVIVGVLGAVAAAVTGLADWSDTYGAERTVGLLHAALNTLALVLFIISAALRLGASDGASVAAITLDFIGLISVLAAAYYGGDMVFDKGTAVNHTAWEAGAEEFEPALAVADLPEHTLRRVTVAGIPVVVLKTGERYFAIAATCTHAGGPLDEGELQAGDVVQCPWHGSRFRLRDGKPLTGPATIAQPRYETRVRDGMLELRRA